MGERPSLAQFGPRARSAAAGQLPRAALRPAAPSAKCRNRPPDGARPARLFRPSPIPRRSSLARQGPSERRAKGSRGASRAYPSAGSGGDGVGGRATFLRGAISALRRRSTPAATRSREERRKRGIAGPRLERRAVAAAATAATPFPQRNRFRAARRRQPVNASAMAQPHAATPPAMPRASGRSASHRHAKGITATGTSATMDCTRAPGVRINAHW